jgi:quercetin dioxygenase-like cupin family protein
MVDDSEERSMAKLSYTKWDDIEVEALNPLLGRQFIVGEDVMVARILMKKGAFVPRHSHYNEQITYVFEGALKFTIDNKEITVRPGEVLCIPRNMPHEAIALEDTVELDIFNPPRADWIAKTDNYLRSNSQSAATETVE